MTCLIACLSTGKGTWTVVSQLMNSADWEAIYLVMNPFAIEKFSHEKKFISVLIEDNATVDHMKKTIREQLQGKIMDTEIALNLVSGTGSEHMAVLSALLSLGLGVRLVLPQEKNKLLTL